MNHRRRSDVGVRRRPQRRRRVADRHTVRARRAPGRRAAHRQRPRPVQHPATSGLHVWRLQSYPLDTLATARPVDASTPAEEGRYTVSPLGYDLPLFNVPRAEEELTHLAAEPNVAAPLRRRPLHDELSERRRARAEHRTDFTEVYFDDSQPVFRVVLDAAASDRTEVPPEQIAICDLSDPDDPPDDRLAAARRDARA